MGKPDAAVRMSRRVMLDSIVIESRFFAAPGGRCARAGRRGWNPSRDRAALARSSHSCSARFHSAVVRAQRALRKGGRRPPV